MTHSVSAIRKVCDDKEMYFSWKKAKLALTFFEKYITHVKGEKAGEKLKLERWQRKIIKRVFGWMTGEDLRVIREVYIEVPRKNGKSFLAAGFALYLFYADGEAGAEVVSAAADTEQAALVYDVAKQMVVTNPKLQSRTKAYRRAMSVYETASKYQVISSDAYTKHGKNLSGIIVDELHAQPDRELVDVLLTSTSARKQPLTVYLTTAGYDRNSICWEKHYYAVRLIEGSITDYRFYPCIFAADEKDDWTDPKTWYKANPNLGVSKRLEYMIAECEKAKNNPAYENTFKRLDLNIWTEQDIRWMPMKKWEECGEVELNFDSFAGEDAFLGLDLSSREDLTSLATVFARPQPNGLPEFYAFMHYFLPEEKVAEKELYKGFKAENLLHTTPGAVTDYAYIEKLIDDLNERVHVKEIAFDRWNASQTSINLDQKGYVMVPFGQGFGSMSAPTKELLGLVLTKRLHHGGNKVLRWNAANVTVEQNAAGDIKPSKRKSMDKIDGMVALIMAIDRAMRHVGGGSVYAERGIIFVG